MSSSLPFITTYKKFYFCHITDTDVHAVMHLSFWMIHMKKILVMDCILLL